MRSSLVQVVLIFIIVSGVIAIGNAYFVFVLYLLKWIAVAVYTDSQIGNVLCRERAVRRHHLALLYLDPGIRN